MPVKNKDLLAIAKHIYENNDKLIDWRDLLRSVVLSCDVRLLNALVRLHKSYTVYEFEKVWQIAASMNSVDMCRRLYELGAYSNIIVIIGFAFGHDSYEAACFLLNTKKWTPHEKKIIKSYTNDFPISVRIKKLIRKL